jgi:hypothetical protein
MAGAFVLHIGVNGSLTLRDGRNMGVVCNLTSPPIAVERSEKERDCLKMDARMSLRFSSEVG